MSVAPEDITILIIRAPGYAGATWVNLVLGSHPDALAMGPPKRIMTLPPEEANQACFVHRSDCTFWPEFVRRGGHDGRFFQDLAEHSGKRVFVINYPPKELVAREIDGKGFRVLQVKLVRDGRPNVFSFLRHKELGGKAGLVKAIREWLLVKWDLIDRKIDQRDDAWMLLRYEDLVNHTEAELTRLGQFVGLDYAADATRFWRYEHHLAAGNTGVLDTLCRMNGLPGYDHRRKAAYDNIVDRLQSEPDLPVVDDSWERGFSRDDRLIFDALAGERNAAYGYPRDSFSEDERADCLAHLERPASPWSRVKDRVAGMMWKS